MSSTVNNIKRKQQKWYMSDDYSTEWWSRWEFARSLRTPICLMHSTFLGTETSTPRLRCISQDSAFYPRVSSKKKNTVTTKRTPWLLALKTEQVRIMSRRHNDHSARWWAKEGKRAIQKLRWRGRKGRVWNAQHADSYRTCLVRRKQENHIK